MRDKSYDGWEIMRAISGSGPSHPVFPTRRQCLAEMRPGEKLLVIRKHGGLGDILISSMLFHDLLEQFNIEVAYAVPPVYHPLFDGHGLRRLRILDFEEVYGARYEFSSGKFYAGPTSPYHSHGIYKPLLEEFDLIEDISAPCRNWEGLMAMTGAIYGQRGLRWRNRAERWANWIGFDIRTAKSILVPPTEAERQAVRDRWDLGQAQARSRPLVVWSPVSMSEDRTFPWFMEVTDRLADAGFDVRYLHWGSLGLGTIHGVTLREMGAVVAEADVVLSVDTASFHWGGLLRRPTVGLFNVLLGASHAKFFETARTLQLCSTPCVAMRYYRQTGGLFEHPYPHPCDKWFAGPVPKGTSSCFHPESVEEIVKTVVEMVKPMPCLALPSHAGPRPAVPSSTEIPEEVSSANS